MLSQYNIHKALLKILLLWKHLSLVKGSASTAEAVAIDGNNWVRTKIFPVKSGTLNHSSSAS